MKATKRLKPHLILFWFNNDPTKEIVWLFEPISQLTFTRSKSTIETLKNVWNMVKVNN